MSQVFDYPLISEINQDQIDIYDQSYSINSNTLVSYTERKKFLIDLKFLVSLNIKDGLYDCMYIDSSKDMKQIEFLSGLFPNIIFNCYNISIQDVNNRRNVIFFKKEPSLEEFKNKMVSNRTQILISWISKSSLEVQKELLNSGLFQAASLKFPLDNLPKSYEYISGKLIYNIWDTKTSKECRIYTYEPSIMKEYNIDIISKNIENHNIVRSYYRYENPIDPSEEYINPDELLNDFDSCYEVMIISSYLFNIINENDLTKETIYKFSNLLTKSLNSSQVFISLNTLRKKQNGQ